jgi:hypothetical protein
MAQRLPYLDFKSWQGLWTKPSTESLTDPRQLRVAENCDFFERYGAISKIKGNRRVLTSQYTEDGIAQKISWVHFHKAINLDGQVLRHPLVAAGSTLGRIEDDGTITTLLTDRKKGKFHTADRLDRFTFISNHNPDLIGDGNDLVKYDGANITKWGIIPPGSQETVIDTFYSAHKWITINCTASEEAVVTFDGDSVRVDKTGTDSAYFAIERSLSKEEAFYVHEGRDLTKAVENRVNCQVYIPTGSLTPSETDTTSSFAPSGAAVAVHVESETDAAAWLFTFSIGELVEGWNQLNLDFSNGVPGGSAANAPSGSAPFGTFDPESDAVEKIKFEFYLNVPSTTVSGVRLDRLVLLDEGTPAVTSVGETAGELSGVYQYKTSFVSKFGNESNVGPASISISASGAQAFYLSDIPTSTDPQVLARRLYRTVANGSVFLFLDEIFDNTTKDYEDRTPDGSLADTTAPQAGDFSDDNSPPPKGGIVKSWQKTVFIAGDPANPEVLAYSEDDEPESFPLINTLNFDSKITAMYETRTALIVNTETGMWQVQGENPDWAVDKLIHNIGCVGRRAAGTARLIGYSVDRDGLRLFDGNTPIKISESIRDKFEDDTIDKTTIELIHTVHSRRDNAILEFNPTNGAGDYKSIFMYQYISDNIDKGMWSEVVTPTAANLNFLDSAEVEDRDGNYKIYVGGADGMVYELFYPGIKNWVDASGTEYPIDTRFRSPYLRPGDIQGIVESTGASGRIHPRHVELRQADIDASTWTVTLDAAEGPDQPVARSTSNLSMQFGVNNSMIRQPVPQNDFIPSTYFRIQVRNNEQDVAGTITAARVYFNVQESQYEILEVDDSTS